MIILINNCKTEAFLKKIDVETNFKQTKEIVLDFFILLNVFETKVIDKMFRF